MLKKETGKRRQKVDSSYYSDSSSLEELNREINKLQKQLRPDRTSLTRYLALLFIFVSLVAGGIVLVKFGPQFLGLVTYSEEFEVPLQVSTSSNLALHLVLNDSPSSLRLSGVLVGPGNAAVYLLLNDTRLLVAEVVGRRADDSITGMATGDVDQLGRNFSGAETMNLSTEFPNNISEIANEDALNNALNQSLANQTNELLNQTVQFNDTVSNETGAVNQSAQNSILPGNGNPENENAPEPLPTEPIETVSPVTWFYNTCVETCSINGVGSNITLIIEVHDATLNLTKLGYTVTRERVEIEKVSANISMHRPYWNSNVSAFSIYGTFVLNLSKYFVDQDNHSLTYLATSIDNAAIDVDNEILTITAGSCVQTAGTLTLFASDLNFTVSQDVFVNISTPCVNVSAGWVQGRAVVGQPVIWRKQVIPQENGSFFELPDFASNVEVTKIVGGKQYRVAKERLFTAKKGPGISEAANAFVINESGDSFEVQYDTPAPRAAETDLSKSRKRIVVSSDVPYTNILTFTSIPDSKKESIRLYWLVNDSRTDITFSQLFNLTFIDSNNNSLIDRLEWITPHLSNQTFEVSITILTVQSYPMVGGEWTVAFNTTGVANLTIFASNGTTYGTGLPDDLEFLELRCGAAHINASFNGTHVFFANYECNSTGYHSVRVHTGGKHTQTFVFGDQQAEAYNWAGWLNVSLKSPPNGATISDNNFTLRCNATINNSIKVFDNISLYTDFSGTWKINKTINFGHNHKFWDTGDLGDAYSIGVADLDHDRKLNDLIVSTMDTGTSTPYIRAYFPNGSVRWSASPAPDGTGYVFAATHIADIDGDTYLDDIVVLFEDGRVSVYNQSGKNCSEISTGTYQRSMAETDRNGDGVYDTISLGDEYNGEIRTYNITPDRKGWTLAWQNLTVNNYVFEIQGLDANGDGKNDEFLYDADYLVFVAKARNGTRLWIHNQDDISSLRCSSATAIDLDHDGKSDEVVFGAGRYASSQIYAVRGDNGAIIWSKALSMHPSAEAQAEVVPADLDNDGWRDDIVIADYYIFGLDNSSNLLWTFTQPTGYINSIAVGDLNKDGQDEIVAGGEDDTVYVLNRTGNLLWKKSLSQGHIGLWGGKGEAIKIADFNNDGVNDFAVATAAGYVTVFSLSGKFVNAIFNFSTGLRGGSYKWNCRAYDNASNNRWGSSNWTFTRSILNVSLKSPPSGTIVYDTNVTLRCNATELSPAYLKNISLYTDVTGTWKLNQTVMPGEFKNTSNTTFLAHWQSTTKADHAKGTATTSSSSGITYSAGKFGAGVSIGSGDDLSYSTNNFEEKQGTIAFWFYPSWDPGGPAVGTHFFFSEDLVSYNNDVWIYYDDGTMGLGYDDRIYICIVDSSNHCVARNVSRLNANEWHHVTAVWSKSHDVNGTRNEQIYIDGDANATVCDGDCTSNTAISGKASDFQVGTWSKVEGEGHEASAVMDEFIIINDTLTPAEVRRLYNAQAQKYRNATANFTITGLRNGTYKWNCRAYDNASNNRWGSSNWTFTRPGLSVRLKSPPSDTTLPGSNVTLRCNATDLSPAYIKNISLYTNISGTWKLNQTVRPGEFKNTSNTTFLAHWQSTTKADHAKGTATPASTSGITYSAGKFGAGVSIGSGDDLSYSTNNFEYKQGTIAFWFYPSWDPGSAAADWHFFFAEDAVSKNQDIWIWYDDGSSGLGNEDLLYFCVVDTAGHCSVRNISKFNANEWHHVTAVWSQSHDVNGTRNQQIYIDGDANATGCDGTDCTSNTALNAKASDFQVGTVSKTDGEGHEADAVMDEFIIINDTLTPAEVRRLYNAQAQKYRNATANFTLTGLGIGKAYKWNCRAYDNVSINRWGGSNWTFNTFLILGDCTGTDPQPSQNWVINDNTVCTGQTVALTSGYDLYVNGNLTFNKGFLKTRRTNVSAAGSMKLVDTRLGSWVNANLTIFGKYYLSNSTLRINGTSNGKFGIKVQPSGTMVINESSNITNGKNASAHIFFVVKRSSSFNMSNSFLSEAGWANAYDQRGLELNTTVKTFRGNTFINDYNGFSIYSQKNIGSNFTIINSTQNGIYIDSIENCSFNSGTITGSGFAGIYCNQNCRRDNFTGITITGGQLGTRFATSQRNLFKNMIVKGATKDNIFQKSSNYNNTFVNLTVRDAKQKYGFHFTDESAENKIINCTIKNNTLAGVYLNASGNPDPKLNFIYNNFFNNSKNVKVDANMATTNFLNRTLSTTALNIIFSRGFGGNYWTNSTGTGFSDTCLDVAVPYGICDSSYSKTNGTSIAVDWLPLAKDRWPWVKLRSPASGSLSFEPNITLRCNATSNVDRRLKNISLYTNLSGTWKINSSIDLLSPRRTSYQANFSFANLRNGSYKWNCLVFDNSSWNNFAASNWTFRLLYGAVTTTLLSPASGATVNATNVILRCEAVSNKAGRVLKNISLYTNTSGTWKLNSSVDILADKKTTYQANFTLTSLTKVNNKWNCLAFDNTSVGGWAASNWTFNVNFPPAVMLRSPPHQTTLPSTNVTLRCNASTSSALKNISLFTDFSGTWKLNSSVDLSSPTRTFYQANFSFTGLSYGDYNWNCLAFSSLGTSGWASSNWTVSVPEQGFIVRLKRPPTGTTLLDTNVTLRCNATDLPTAYIKNISVYTNISGTWKLNQTVRPGEFKNTSNTTFLAHWENTTTADHAKGQATPKGEAGINVTRGKFGTGIYFGLGDQLNYSKDNIDENQGTIAFWFKPQWDPGSASDHCHMFFDEEPATDTNEIQIDYDVSSQCLGNLNQLYCVIWASGNPHAITIDISSWNANEWHHVACVWHENGDVSGTNNIMIYADGSSSGASCEYLCTANWDVAAKTDFNIGTESKRSSLGYEADAVMDEFMIINDSLTAAEISALYNAQAYKYKNATANFTFSGLGSKDYKWNCVAFDNASSLDWGNSNWTFSVGDNAGPIISNCRLNASSVFQNSPVRLNCSVTDFTGVNYVWAQFSDYSGALSNYSMSPRNKSVIASPGDIENGNIQKKVASTITVFSNLNWSDLSFESGSLNGWWKNSTGTSDWTTQTGAMCDRGSGTCAYTFGDTVMHSIFYNLDLSQYMNCYINWRYNKSSLESGEFISFRVFNSTNSNDRDGFNKWRVNGTKAPNSRWSNGPANRTIVVHNQKWQNKNWTNLTKSKLGRIFRIGFIENASAADDLMRLDNINLTCEGGIKDTNTSYTTYTSIPVIQITNVTNITVIVNVTRLNSLGSTKRGQAGPLLSLELYNGSKWFNTNNITVTSVGNKTMSTTDGRVVSRWNIIQNRRLRIRGVMFDYVNKTYADEINWSAVYVYLKGQNKSVYQYIYTATSTAGTYNVTFVYGNDTNGKKTSSAQTLSFTVTGTIDTTGPIVTYVSKTPNNNARNIVNWIYVNATVVDSQSNIDTCLLEWNNQTHIKNWSMTKVGTGTSVYCMLNMSTKDGFTYIYKVHATDSVGNHGNSSTRTNIENSKPSISSLDLTPNNPNRNNDLTCAFTITDSQAGDTLYGNYSWKNGSVIKFKNWRQVSNGVQYNLILSHLNTSYGKWWNCTITPYDGYEYGTMSSDKVWINNTVPPRANLSYPPKADAFFNRRKPLFNWTPITDPDSDSLKFRIQVAYDYNFGTLVVNNGTLITNKFNRSAEFALSTQYFWKVQVNDSLNLSPWSNIWNFTVQPYVAIRIYNKSISFGTMFNGQYEDTSDQNPGPFKLQNDGNIGCNVSISSTILFTTAPLDRKYYQYKARATAEEPSSFNTTGSKMNWANMTAANASVVKTLNHTDSKDEAYVDVRLEIPLTEPPLARRANVTFWSEQS
jgi:hypothetical protein